MPADLDSVLRLEVPVIVRVAERRIPVDLVVRWVPGAIIELQKAVEDELDLLVNNVPIGRGVAVKVGENFGIKIRFVGDLRSRINAFGSAAAAAGDVPAPSGADDEAARLAEQLLAGQTGIG